MEIYAFRNLFLPTFNRLKKIRYKLDKRNAGLHDIQDEFAPSDQ